MIANGMLLRRLAQAALVAAALSAGAAFADPAADIAAQAQAVEDALAAKMPDAAEVLARAAVSLAESAFGAESVQAANLDRLLGDSLFNQRRYADAEPYYRRAFAIREAKLGEGSLDTVVSANDLAIVLKRLEVFPESEAFYRKVVDLRSAILGPNDPATARALYFLADIIDTQARYGEAADMMAKAVAAATVAFGAKDPTTVEWMGLRAAMLHDSGDLAAAELAYLEANRLGEEVFDAGDTRLAYTRQSLANLYYNAGRPADAAPLYRLALTAREAAFGPDDPATIGALDGLAHALWAAGESEGTGQLFQRLLAYRERTDGADAASVADVLRMVGWAADRDSRKADAEIAFKRVIEISEARLGPTSPYTALDLIALGTLYSGQQRFEEARPLLVRGVGILEAAPETRSAAASARTALALLEQASGNGAEAIALARKSLDDTIALGGKGTREAADIEAILAGLHLEAHDLGAAVTAVSAALDTYLKMDPGGRNTLRAQSTLAAIRHEQGRLDDALTLQRQVLDALVERYGADSSEIWAATAEVAGTLLDTGDAAGAADAFGRAASIVGRLATIDAGTAFSARTGAVEDQALAAAKIYDGLLISQWQLAAADPSQAAGKMEAAFLTAQRVIDSRAANAQAQMAARAASGSPELAGLVRERQDLVADWQKDDLALSAALGAAATPGDTGPLRNALAKADARITAIDATLNARYPAFAHLQRPAPLSVAEVQSRLAENEVLLFYADTGTVGTTGAESYLWVVPKTGTPTWVRLAHGPAELRAGVRQFREAMGVGLATRGPTALVKAQGPDRTDRVLIAAHELYATLLGNVAPLIAGKSLVIVPSRSLAALPFHALVSQMPAAASTDRFRDAHWVARDHAITILPSVTSLAAPVPGAATVTRATYVAFANPLLTGRSGNDRRAFDRTACGPAGGPPAPQVDVADATDLPALPSLFRGAEADVAAVRALPPLPETADEVCAIAASLGTEASAIHIGAGASETAVKALSADGTLAAARILHFATHGLVSGDLSGLAEPAIVLTPPDAASAGDDGLLTASEVTGLKLDADWVILSACNTAAGDAGGEALSGLARAFFYAGARALLVSHWPVSSDAAVRLTTTAIAALEADPSIGKAEAMRRAMLAEIERGGVAADPVSWAPFIVVGE